ncbi:hypothetical protein [Serinicoccus chungangensis]|nr:hypothetical protein [Serinicoccus chungangensis]
MSSTAPLEVPSAVCGSAREASVAWRPHAREAVSRGRWPEVDLDPAAEQEGLIVLAKAPQLAEAGVHLHLPATTLATAAEKGTVGADVEQALVEQAWEEPWSFASLLAPAAQLLTIPPARHRPFAQAAARHWPVLESVGPRWTVGDTSGATLWGQHTTLWYVLGQLGVPAERLTQPLPSGGVDGLLADAGVA